MELEYRFDLVSDNLPWQLIEIQPDHTVPQ